MSGEIYSKIRFLGSALLSDFNQSLSSSDISQSGLVIDDTAYLQEPVTRGRAGSLAHSAMEPS